MRCLLGQSWFRAPLVEAVIPESRLLGRSRSVSTSTTSESTTRSWHLAPAREGTKALKRISSCGASIAVQLCILVGRWHDGGLYGQQVSYHLF